MPTKMAIRKQLKNLPRGLDETYDQSCWGLIKMTVATPKHFCCGCVLLFVQ
jgi:hypothetical protein